MPIQSQWDDTNRMVILQSHSTEWTWQELHTHHAQVTVQMVASVQCSVALIVDMRQTYWLASTDFVVNVRKSIDTYTRLKVDMIVFVLTDSSIGALMVNAHRQFDPSQRQYLTVSQVDAARTAIAQRRAQST